MICKLLKAIYFKQSKIEITFSLIRPISRRYALARYLNISQLPHQRVYQKIIFLISRCLRPSSSARVEQSQSKFDKHTRSESMIPPVRHVCPEGRFSQIQGWHQETGWLERGGQWELPLWKPLRTPAVWREGCMGKIDVVFVVEIYQSNNV